MKFTRNIPSGNIRPDYGPVVFTEDHRVRHCAAASPMGSTSGVLHSRSSAFRGGGRGVNISPWFGSVQQHRYQSWRSGGRAARGICQGLSTSFLWSQGPPPLSKSSRLGGLGCIGALRLFRGLRVRPSGLCVTDRRRGPEGGARPRATLHATVSG